MPGSVTFEATMIEERSPRKGKNQPFLQTVAVTQSRKWWRRLTPTIPFCCLGDMCPGSCRHFLLIAGQRVGTSE